MACQHVLQFKQNCRYQLFLFTKLIVFYNNPLGKTEWRIRFWKLGIDVMVVPSAYPLTC